MEQQQDIDVDISALWRALTRAKFKILVFVIIVFFAVLFIATTISPKYRAETRILIEMQEAQFTRVDTNAGNARGVLDAESIQSQVEVLRSTDLLSTVAKELKLHELSEFNDAKPSASDQLLITMGVRQRQPAMETEDRVLREFRERLKVFRVENSRVIVISFQSKDAQLSAKVPDTIADIYLRKQRELKVAADSNATDWLGPEIDALRSRVKAAEARVAQFRSQSDILPSTNGQSTLGTQQLSELSTELSRLRANRASAQATIDSVKASIGAGGSLSAIPSVLSSASVQRLRDRETQLRAQLTDLTTTLLNGHPRVISARAQLRDVQTQIRIEAEKELASLKTQVRTAQLREQQVQDELNALKVRTAAAGEQAVELRALEREAASERGLLESYLIRFNAASSRQQGSYVPADARIFSRAIVPTEPFAPKIVPMVGGAIMGALLLSVVFVLISELFSGRAMRRTSHGSMPAHQPMDDDQYYMQAELASMQQAAMQQAAMDQQTMPHAPLHQASMHQASMQRHAPVQPRANVENSAMMQREQALYDNPPMHQMAPQPMQQAAPAEQPRSGRGPSLMNAKAALGAMMGSGSTALQAHPASAPAAREIRISPVPVVANTIVAAGNRRAIILSSNGSVDTASSVLFARYLADQNMMALVIDLTLDAAVTLPMLDNANEVGFTNVLCNELELAEAIVIDHYSSCHIIPRGNANPALALRNIGELPRMLNTLERAYDIVVLAVGEADAEGITGLMNRKTGVVLSAFDPDIATIEAKLDSLAQAGIKKVHLMQPELPQGASSVAA